MREAAFSVKSCVFLQSWQTVRFNISVIKISVFTENFEVFQLFRPDTAVSLPLHPGEELGSLPARGRWKRPSDLVYAS
jgi:hypothetical protein